MLGKAAEKELFLAIFRKFSDIRMDAIGVVWVHQDGQGPITALTCSRLQREGKRTLCFVIKKQMATKHNAYEQAWTRQNRCIPFGISSQLLHAGPYCQFQYSA